VRSFLFFLGGLITGVIVLVGGGYAAFQYYVHNAGEYRAEWLPDFNEELFESAAELAAAESEYERWVAVGDVGLWNVDAGDLDKAKSFAYEALTIAEKYKGDWNYGNAVHKGHLTLGRIALRENNILAANKQLAPAGNTPGPPQLNSFGPNMVLAKELLEKGEREAVLEYFDACEKFWNSEFSELDEWKEQVQSGDMPRFGANLIY